MTHPTLSSTVTIAPGVELPRLGLGVFRAGKGMATREAVRHALNAGYRHIDTARMYRNELEVGEALRQSKVPREEIFVTTKLWNDDHGYDEALRAFDQSLDALGLEVIDLYLIHWPVSELRGASWRALEQIAASGRARAIGVSNYTERHLQELFDTSEVRPAVNQVEVHPFLPQRALRTFCKEQGIAVVAYSPLTKGRRLDHPTIASVAAAVGRTPAQVLLRWGLQSDLVIIPKSSQKRRIYENAALYDFELDADHMQQLATLADDTRTSRDPSAVV